MMKRPELSIAACEAVEASPAAFEERGESEDAMLVRRAQRGDRAALSELHRRYARMIHAIVLARVAPGDADDLAQDVFVHAIARLHTLREPSAFGGWMATIARNAARDHRRRRRPEQAFDDERAVHGGAGAVSGLRAKEALAAIARLPEAYREVLLMRLVEGMTGPEIATRAGLTPGSVRVNLHRGMKLLRKELGIDEEEAP